MGRSVARRSVLRRCGHHSQHRGNDFHRIDRVGGRKEVTPVEGEVIAAAVAWYRSGGKAGGLDRLANAVAEIVEPDPEWVPATLLLCLAGDHIRIGQDETDVIRSSAGIWHADTSDAWRPRAWKHTELRMDLSANPGFQEYPPNLACEILCTPERTAALLLQTQFPGSAVISSDVD